MAEIVTIGGKEIAAEETTTPLSAAVAVLVARATEHQEATYWGSQRRQMALRDAGITRYGLGPDGQPEVEYGGEREVPDSFDP
jgi:hypothetical protein